MAKKNVTIDDLAIMVQKGFNDMTENMATKKQVEHVDKRVEKVELSLTTLKDFIIEGQKRKIEKIEEEIKELREMFAM